MKQVALMSVGLLGLALSAGAWEAHGLVEPVPFKVPAKLPDVAEVLSPAAIQLGGFLGERVAVNERNRLLQVEEAPLLAGFQKKPGSHPWIGEHVGKWMHAATLAWAYTGDPALRAKLDRVAAALIQAQEPDGYLGTYTPDKRFGLYPGADWDVWSHKYNLIGLLTYYQYTGNEAALTACRKVGDLLINTFGPGKKSILSAGTHVGMAATSVLEPVVVLYRLTGDERYLAFARYIVRSWDEPNGPKIIEALLREKQVNKTANGKAYEMLSNLVGLGELARATGDRHYLEPVLNAWQDIVAKRLYVTGSASQGEHFHGDYDLPNQKGAAVAETCVTTTWIQLNLQLLRLTGEARFGAELERTFYNHLAAAQHPAGADWCYFTPLEGRKDYLAEINCCHSSGPRGMALVPQASWLICHDGPGESLAMNLFEPSRVTAQIGGQTVRVDHRTDFPRRGGSTLTLSLRDPAAFGFRIRVPEWTGPLRAAINGHATKHAVSHGWLEIPSRQWHNGDHLRISYDLGARLILGAHGNQGKAALAWGPLVLAFDQKRNPTLPAAGKLGFLGESARRTAVLKAAGPGLAFDVTLGAGPARALRATLVPFAEAGRDGGVYRVWLLAPGTVAPADSSLLGDGTESRSREGNQGGSIIDGDAGSFVVTFDNQPAQEDWYAVKLASPVTIRRVVFTHGRNFHDGGWFDTSPGKPRIQVKRIPDGPWETVAELADYPPTTSTNNAGIKAGQSFSQRLPEPVRATAVRVVGKPACGDNPRQAFSSCGELAAFGD